MEGQGTRIWKVDNLILVEGAEEKGGQYDGAKAQAHLQICDYE
jgi:hypothetical protein